jgi:hypothetical protein
MAIVLVRPFEFVEGDVDAEEDGVDECVAEMEGVIIDVGTLIMTGPDEMEAEDVVETSCVLCAGAAIQVFVSIIHD